MNLLFQQVCYFPGGRERLQQSVDTAGQVVVWEASHSWNTSMATVTHGFQSALVKITPVITNEASKCQYSCAERPPHIYVLLKQQINQVIDDRAQSRFISHVSVLHEVLKKSLQKSHISICVYIVTMTTDNNPKQQSLNKHTLY